MYLYNASQISAFFRFHLGLDDLDGGSDDSVSHPEPLTDEDVEDHPAFPELQHEPAD